MSLYYDNTNYKKLKQNINNNLSKSFIYSFYGLSILLFIQIIWGAFMAGLKAGHVSYTFPKMNSQWIPKELYSSYYHFDLIGDPVYVHLIHRIWEFLLE